MAVAVYTADPQHPEAVRLLTASHALMRALFEDACYFLSVEELAASHISFWLADIEGSPAGCCAMARKDGYAEVKSMFVDPEARGLGVGEALLSNLIETARAEGIALLRLETGDRLDAAHRLYTRAGFTFCEVFDGYDDVPSSLFMEMRLQ